MRLSNRMSLLLREEDKLMSKKPPELTTKQFICGVIIVLLVFSVFGFTGEFEWGKINAGQYLLIMLAHFVAMLFAACIGGDVITDADEVKKGEKAVGDNSDNTTTRK